MKRIMPVILLFSLVLSGCQNTPLPTATTPPVKKTQTESPAGFLRAEGQALVAAQSGDPLRLRAINFTHDPTRQDYTDARSMGFNTVRLALGPDVASNTGTGSSWLDTQVTYARDAGLYLIPGFKTDQSRLWSDPAAQTAILDFWAGMARRYAGEPVIAAYDLLDRPSPAGLDQWQSLAGKITGVIRAADTNHPLIVQAALVPDRTFIYLEDSNYILGFDFFKPYEFTAFSQRQYPNDTLFQPSRDDFRLSENISNPALAAGTTDWTETGASLNLVVNRETVIGIPGVACDHLLGSAWFSNFAVREYDEAGGYLRNVQTVDLAQTGFSGPWNAGENTIIEMTDDSPWGQSGRSIHFASRQAGQPVRATNADPDFSFEAVPGRSYTINGWIRGEDVNPDANCRFIIEFYSYAGRDPLILWDRDHLQRELGRLARYGKYHNLPMMLVDFGLARSTLDNGGTAWAQDMFDLLDQFSWSYAWRSYRNDRWGIYPEEGSAALDPSLAALFQRAEPPLRSSSPAESEPALIRPVDGFIHAKGQSLVVGPSGEEIHLSGINFGNDLYTPTFPFMPHHARRDFFEVRRMGFNVIRFNLTHEWFSSNSEQGWAWLDQQIAWAKEAGVYLIINMHYVPGQDYASISTDPVSQAQTVDLWRSLAGRYQDETIIAGYDLMNEPFQVDPVVYQAYMQNVVDAIREVDTHHLIIVEAIPGYTPEFVTLEDDNLMYDSHQYYPASLTNENTLGLFDTKTYPDPDTFEIRWDRLEKYLGPARTTSLPPGSSDWVLYESPVWDPGKAQDAQAFGAPARICKGNHGTAYFGDFQILAWEGSGSPRVLEDVTINPQSILWKDPDPGSVIFGLSPQNHDDSPGGRSLTVRESGSAGWNEVLQGTFEVQPDTKYQIKGWMKGDEVSPGADCYYVIDFFQLDSQDKLLRHDRDFLEERMMAGIQFGDQNNVPINVGEFGVFQTTFLSPEAGGARWTTDMLDLLGENHLNFAYWDYHGAWGLYPDEWHYPDPADINTPLLNVFLSRIKK